MKHVGQHGFWLQCEWSWIPREYIKHVIASGSLECDFIQFSLGEKACIHIRGAKQVEAAGFCETLQSLYQTTHHIQVYHNHDINHREDPNSLV
jgi:hypothetical protein